jgi:hypothetical protein
VEEHVSPDGRLRLRIAMSEDGDLTLGFVGFPWHTHADILAATTGLPEAEAVPRFIDDLVQGASVVVLWSVGGEVRDIWVSDDPEQDAAYPQPGESVELRYWDGRAWTGCPR